MRILMFIDNPFTNDPRVYNEARSLVQAGHQVAVIAFDNEKQNPQRQDLDGIQVIRLRTRLSPIRGFGWPVWNALNLLLWQWQAYRQALTLHKQACFHLIHCHDFDTLPIGVGLKVKLGLPLIYDAHEIYGYIMARAFPHWIANVFLWLEKKLITKVVRIVTDGEGKKRYFDGITDKPISVIMNCKLLESLEYQPPDNEGRFTILYIGVLHKARSIPMLIDTMKQLPDVHCVIGGIGSADYVQVLKEKCDMIPNVDFIGKVSFDQVIPMTKKADVVLLIINPQDLNNRLGLANKQFEAMVCGRPIICTKGTYSGELTEQEEVGLVVEYSEEALKQAIIKLRDDKRLRERLGRNALRAAITKYNWQNQERKLLELYESFNVCL
jgi:glycosyltransferase involved in cell wall biosynthesis